MNVLLLRPIPSNERFGLGPFFRIEPLGMEYIATALESEGHRVTLADLRFSPALARVMRDARPDQVERYVVDQNIVSFGVGDDRWAEVADPDALEALGQKLIGH